MVRNYKRKRIPTYTENDLRAAIFEVQSNIANISQSCRKYKVPRKTLRQYLARNKNSPPGVISLRTNTGPCFYEKQAEELIRTILQLQTMFYGLKSNDICKAAFQFAEIHEIKNRFDKSKKIAGKEWLHKFTSQNKITSRKEESTVNLKKNISVFFSSIKDIIEKYFITTDCIYNLDELVLIDNKVTLIGSASAAGICLNPMIILPEEFSAEIHSNMPGNIFKKSSEGVLTEELYYEYLLKFIDQTNPSEHKQILLIMDGLYLHKSLHAIKLCRENFIHLVVVPPNAISRLQPLHYLYEHFKVAYDELKANDNLDLVPVLEQSISYAFQPQNISQSYALKGIFPLNANILEEDDEFFTTKADKVVEYTYYWEVNLEELASSSTFDLRLLKKEVVEERFSEEESSLQDFKNVLKNMKKQPVDDDDDEEEGDSQETFAHGETVSGGINEVDDCLDLNFFENMLPILNQFNSSQRKRLKIQFLQNVNDIASENEPAY